LVGEPEDELEAALAQLDDEPPDAPGPVAARARPALHDRRERGIAGTVTAVVASGERVLVVAADARARRAHLAGRPGGFALCAGPPAVAGRALRVLCEVGLVEVDRDARRANLVESAGRADLDRSPTMRAAGTALAESRALLAPKTARAA